MWKYQLHGSSNLQWSIAWQIFSQAETARRRAAESEIRLCAKPENTEICRITEPSLTSKTLAEGLKEQDASELDPVSQQEQQEQAVSQMDPRGREKG